MTLPINKTPCPVVLPSRNRPCTQTTTLSNYVPEEEDAPFLVNNLVAQPVKEDQGEEKEKNYGEEANREEEEDRRKDVDETQADSGQKVDEEENNYSEYLDSDVIYEKCKTN